MKTRKRWLLGGFVTAGLLISLAIALFASPFSSSSPDGMSRVAINTGFSSAEKTSRVEGRSPVGGYAVKGVGNGRVSTGLAGGIGVLATFGMGYGVFSLLRASRRRQAPSGPTST